MTAQVLWEKICSDHNLRSAWNRVRENKGSPGVDSVTLEEYEKDLADNLNTLQQELENGDFKPLPVFGVKQEGIANHFNFEKSI